MVAHHHSRLFHVSEEPGLKLFHPRPVPSREAGVSGDAVWAIDEMHLPNYLLPRDCPRVVFRASDSTTAHDKNKFFFDSSTTHTVAVESAWFERIGKCTLYLYEFPAGSFELVDANAGYYISRCAVTAVTSSEINDPVRELLKQNIEVRFLPELWTLRNQVMESTLEYSIIRFKHAKAATASAPGTTASKPRPLGTTGWVT